MIDIYNALTGTVGPTHRIGFKAYVVEGSYGHGESAKKFWWWQIEWLDPRTTRQGYTDRTVSDRFGDGYSTSKDLTAPAAAEKQMRGYLHDLGAVYEEPEAAKRHAAALRAKKYRALKAKAPSHANVTVTTVERVEATVGHS